MKASQFQKDLLDIQGHMMHFALMLTANKEDARDLLQDTTLKVLDNQDKFIDNVNFKGWVLTVMRNLFINNYHKVVRMQTVVEQGVDVYNLSIVSDSDVNSPDTSSDLQEINAAIEQLNREHRIPFTLYLSGYQYNEIAEKMHLPLGTVKSRIFFARQELQKVLKDFRN
ncbi:RNA polymerase sigma factor [Parabacteroides sp. 52]|uniref:RNA polymerase sigma factor n=1 Tax=unclassified Parabacteroides TaxID=2649774 RepID=UPI0013CF9DC8|nr:MULTISPECIES: RNA polymerase sigma factor [unclassified Parabacteroides]MDH6534027.1 RNA polymerase sigma factor (sigma-70 family) [Parabacteroides sp. PM5-20]NDV54769.1 RNA polymerase sigma factor [Parabacteroides sp. 52]